MTTHDLIKKISDSNNITTGRAEMIINIIFERLTEKLKKEGEVNIPDFGKFKVFSKDASGSGYSGTSIFVKNYIIFNPEKRFLDIINS
jgi:nucleoid DNA-binding protein